MKKQKFKNFLISKWYIPLAVVGISVAAATTVTATSNRNQGMSLIELWEKGGDPNHPMHQPLQVEGEKVLGGEDFKPSLDEFIAKKMSNNTTPSGLVVDKSGDGDTAPDRISRELDEFAKIADWQYFFKYSQHAKIVGDHADGMREGTSGKGDIWVSTRIDKVYPIEKTKNTESQCADIVMRVTHYDVPRKTHLGGPDEFVTFWQDFKKKVCQGREIKKA